MLDQRGQLLRAALGFVRLAESLGDKGAIMRWGGRCAEIMDDIDKDYRDGRDEKDDREEDER